MNRTLTFKVGHFVRASEGKTEIYSFDGPVELEGLEIESDVQGRVEIMKIEDGFNVKILDVDLEVTIQCERCLKPFKQEIQFSGPERQYYFDEQPEVTDPNDVFLVDKKNLQIDISSFLRQEIILHFEIIPVCFTGCKGICAYCGKDKNQEKCDCIEHSVPEHKPLAALKELLK